LFGLRPVGDAFRELAAAVFGLIGGDRGFAGLGDYVFFFWQR
jgi:hypothetical protein